MKNSLKCAHHACECRARGSSRYCSNACEAAADGAASCACGHKACLARTEGREGEPSSLEREEI
jgi:hypothetical protein